MNVGKNHLIDRFLINLRALTRPGSCLLFSTRPFRAHPSFQLDSDLGLAPQAIEGHAALRLGAVTICPRKPGQSGV
ncbi:MAG: hypothetical protein ACE5JX_00630 [Acidobacteriota bacterium]